MKKEDIFKLSSMPLPSPSYPKGPYRFIDREYFIIIYQTDIDKIKKIVPEPLEPDGSGLVFFEFIKMPDSFGFGDYVESGLVIPCIFEDKLVNFTSQMYLDCHSPIVAGREVWGFPKKLGYPSLKVNGDTLVGSLKYGDSEIALGTMKYKNKNLLCPNNNLKNCNTNAILEKLNKTQVNLKIIPCVTGGISVLQLVSYRLTDITVKGAWSGEARLDLVKHVNAPIGDLPVREVIEGLHITADLTLPYGEVLHDYLKNKEK